MVRFGSHGVEFPVHFLGEEIEGTARRGIAGHEALEFGEVAAEPGNFLADVTLVSEQGDFLEQPLVIQRQRQAGFFKAAVQGGAVQRSHFGRFPGDLIQQLAEGLEAGSQVHEKMGAFAGAGFVPGREGSGDGRVDHRLQDLRRRGLAAFHIEDAGGTQQGFRGHHHGTAERGSELRQVGGILLGEGIIHPQRRGGFDGGFISHHPMQAPAGQGAGEELPHPRFQGLPIARHPQIDIRLLPVYRRQLHGAAPAGASRLAASKSCHAFHGAHRGRPRARGNGEAAGQGRLISPSGSRSGHGGRSRSRIPAGLRASGKWGRSPSGQCR